jgi:hypothetical protein
MALAGVAVERLVGVGGGWRRGVVGVVAGIEGAAAGLEAGLAGHLDGDPAQHHRRHHRPHPSLSLLVAGVKIWSVRRDKMDAAWAPPGRET